MSLREVTTSPFPATAKRTTRSKRLELTRSLAEHQAGPVGRHQLLARGIPENTIDRWLSAGILLAHLPGVYTLGHRILSDEGQLVGALLYAGPGSALSHTSGAWWMDLLDDGL